MTDFDLRLIEKADRMSRYHYRDIDVLIEIADTKARKTLRDIYWQKYDSTCETN